MSAVMKTFFDRISDLLKIRKDLGRKLRGKTMAVVSCAADEEYEEGFDMPFRESARYLGMTYLGHARSWLENGVIPPQVEINLQELIEKIKITATFNG
jgi:hypothetical protein